MHSGAFLAFEREKAEWRLDSALRVIIAMNLFNDAMRHASFRYSGWCSEAEYTHYIVRFEDKCLYFPHTVDFSLSFLRILLTG